MTSQKQFAAIGAALGVLMLILDGQTALSGAQEGITLCLRTVIPALFPFFTLSPLLIANMDGRWLRPAGKLCGIPKGAEGLLLVGFLGGYPTGAQCVAQSARSGQLSKAQAQRMLSFCNNAGPSFLFGMVAQLFPGTGYAWLLWGIHIISALLTALLLPREDSGPVSLSAANMTLPQALRNAVLTMALVCGWVIFFRIGIAFLSRWFLWLLPRTAQVIAVGILELSNGCWALREIEQISLRFLICSGMLGFGGVCVSLQTRSVTGGLSMKTYFLGKLLQTGISLLLAYMAQFFFSDPLPFSPLALLLILPLLFCCRKREINSSIPQSIGV